MAKYKLRATIGAGLLALGVAEAIPTTDFMRDHQEKIDTYCTSEIKDAIDFRNRQYIELRRLRDCVQESNVLGDQSIETIRSNYEDCMADNLEGLEIIAERYRTHLVDNGVSHEQIADCESVRPPWNYPGNDFWSMVGIGSFASASLGLLSLVSAYRRRKEEE